MIFVYLQGEFTGRVTMNELVEKYLSDLKRKNFMERSQLEDYGNPPIFNGSMQ